jgi:hypothetical protein
MKTMTLLRLRLKASVLSTRQHERQMECGCPGSGTQHSSAALLIAAGDRMPGLLSRWHGLVAGCVMLSTSAHALTLSGRVADDGLGLGGIRINYSWVGPLGGTDSGFVTTDANGNWSSPSWGPATSITLTPAQSTGYSWSPPSRTVSTGAGLSDIGGLNFERTSYSISGTVRGGNDGVGGVLVTLSGAMNMSTTTSPNGAYSFVRLRTGAYTITPSHAVFRFLPTNLITTLAPSRTGQDFRLNPLAATLPATNVGFGLATLNGSVMGEGTNPTRVWFEYGAGTNLNLRTPTNTLPASTNVTLFSAIASNLSGDLNYSYRFAAANTHGTNYGASMSFLMPFLAAGSAMSFNGTSSYVSAGTNPVLRVTTNLTIEAWINPTAPGSGSGGSGGVIAGREGEYLLARFADGTIRYALSNVPPSAASYINTTITTPLNEWTHVALTYAVIGPSSQLRLYTNGVLAFGAIGPRAIATTYTQNDFRIGGRQAFSQFFQGQIDEVRVWDSARTPTEITNNFRRRLVGSESRLLAYFKFDEGLGISTGDSGPNRLTGALLGGATFVTSGARLRDPVAITRAATPVLATRATLHASVNPSEVSTIAYFEYGETTAYDLPATPGQDIGSGLASVPVSASIENLQPGTTYHYRSVAFNSYGTTYGEDQTFTTLVLGVGWPATTKVTGGLSRDPKHAVDSEGNTYIAGLFSGTATFRATLNSSNANPEAFVAKMGRGADWLWESKVISSNNGAIAVSSIALDAARNVYVAGNFSGTAFFGTNVLNAVGQTDAFVAKLNSLGDTWLWARSAGAGQSDSANALAVTPAGGIFVAGHFRGAVSFGTNNLSSAAGSQDIFVASLNSNGTWLWARPAGGTGQNDTALALALNSASEAFLTGTFQGTNAAFGTITNHASGGLTDTDLFVARINTNGLWLVARRAGGAGADAGTGLAVDGAGNVYLVGQFAGTADYSGSVSNLNLGAQARLFIARLNPNCNMLWYAQGGAGFCDSIAVDNLGQVFVSGEFGIPVVSTSFGDPAVTNLVSSGNLDVFIARLDAGSGAWVWARKIGSTGSETRGSIGVDGQGGIVVSGTFQGTVPVGFVLLTTSNERDIFIARLDSRAVFEHNSYVIGQPIPVPLEAQRGSPDDGGAIDQPTISILEKEHADSDALNSFVWSIAEHKLFPVRPVTAIIKWPLAAGGSNTTGVATAVGRSVWPNAPQLHVANTPVELEPAVSGFPYRFVQIAFSTISGASVDSGTKQFTAGQEGWTVLQFLDTGGQLPDPTIHPSRFEVPKTILPNATNLEPATIGTALTHSSHNDPTGKNGFVYFERAFYDGVGEEKSYDRSTRTGPIIPVNKDTSAGDDDLVVVWYRTNTITGIAWPSLAVRYSAQWPTNASELVLAGGDGSGTLDALTYSSKRVYNQPDATLPGFNPNEEHAALYGDVLYALRNDLNDIIKASEPFTLLKYRNPTNSQWEMRVYHVVATNATNQFIYTGEAGQQLEPPAPLSLLRLCGPSNTWVSGPAFKDYQGRLYARAAGLNNGDAAIVTRYWYPLQPGFFYDLDRNGQPDAPVDDCVPWLDRRPGGVLGTPINVTYNITWPVDAPTLQIGETLFGAKFGLPNLGKFARARIIFDEGDPGGVNGIASLARLFDPLAPRTLQLRAEGDEDNIIEGPGYSVFRVDNADALFDGIPTSSDMGMRVFSDLPFALRARLRYDPGNKNLIFRGLLDESDRYGGRDNPLLLINVLSPRERNRIQDLSEDSTFDALIDALYDLTRNPNQLNIDDEDGPDKALLAGLTVNEAGEVLPEVLGEGSKVFSAGMARTGGYVTVIENDDPSLGGLPVKLHVIRLADGPFRGDIKVIQSDNAFDEKLTLRHSADFGGEPQRFEFEWYYRPAESTTNRSLFPTVLSNGDIDNPRGWIRYSAFPPGVIGVNDVTLGDGGESSLLVLANNYFICRYRGYVINGLTNWSEWVGNIGGTEAQLAEGWVNRVRDGLNPFETRTKEFHENETVTFASMLQQAGARYEGDIAFNSEGGNINQVGLIEAYETVLRRAKRLSIEGAPPVRYQPANEALLLAAGFIADLYMLLGNEAVADAADPTIGFRTSSAGYGTLAPSIFTFQNQLDSLLEEEVTLLRGRDDRSASVRVPPVYNRLFWNFTRDEGEVAYAQAYNITDQNGDGFIDATDARIMYPQAHGDAWGHYLTATKTYYSLLQNPNFDWKPRSEEILLSGGPMQVNYYDERKFARAAAAKAKTGAEIVDLTYRLNYVDDPAGQYQGYKDTDPERAWGVSEWAHRAGSAAIFDWITANAVLPAVDADPTHTGITKIDRTTVVEIDEIAAGYESVQAQVDKADAGLSPLGLAKNVVPFDIDPAQIDSGKTHFEQIYDRAIEAMKNSVTVFDHANQLSQALRGLQDSVNNFSRNVDQQERDYKNRLIETFGYPYAGDIGAGKTYPAGYDGPDLYHYMYVNPVEFTGDPEALVTNMVGGIASPFKAFFAPLKKDIIGLTGHFFPKDLPVGVVLPATTNALEVQYPVAASDYSFSAPPEWGRRRAPGELQNALSELLQAESQLKRARINHNNHVLEMEDKAELLQAKYDLEAEKLLIKLQTKAEVLRLKAVLFAAREINKAMKKVEESGGSITDALVESFPKSVGTSTDATAPMRGLAKFANIAKNLVVRGIRFLAERTEEQQKEMIESVEGREKERVEDAEFGAEVQKDLKEIEKMLREEKGLRLDMLAQAQKLDQVAGNYEAAVAKGLRLIEERIAFRKNTAAETQASRYQDMTFSHLPQ